MEQKNKRKIIYPLVGAALALASNTALFFDPLVWAACALGANVLIAAGIVLNAVTLSPEGENSPVRALRVPLIPLLLSLAAGLATGLIARNAVMGLLGAYSWGLVAFPLAIAVLRKARFSSAMLTGLTWSAVSAAGALLIQVLISSPAGSFRPAYCLEQLSNRMTEFFVGQLTQLATAGTGVPYAALFTNMTDAAQAEEFAKTLTRTLLNVAPAAGAVAALFACCLFWWLLKRALRPTDFEVSSMGRLDMYTPHPSVPLVLLVSFLFNLMLGTASPLGIVFFNLNVVISAVLAYGGFSLALYFLNVKIGSRALRILILGGAVLICLFSGFGTLPFVLLGMFSVTRNLRGGIGGTFQ